MRLSIEQAKKYLQGMHRLWLCDEWEQPYDSERCRSCDSHDNCLDIVLSSMSDIAQDLYDTFEALQQENEQLRAVLRKAKKEIQEAIDNYELTGEHEYDISEHLQQALAEIGKAIGGKEDV